MQTDVLDELHYADDMGKNARSEAKMQRAMGSTLFRTVRIDDEFAARIAKASAVFGRLRANIWERNGIKLDTKLKGFGTSNTLVCM